MNIVTAFASRSRTAIHSESEGFFILGMEHQFNVELAKKYGIEEAILIHNLYFWINKNAANGRHFYDGRVWTYNSTKSFAELFPYMTPSKIARVLRSLEEHGIIVRGNYNKSKLDRTCWYAFSDEGILLLSNFGCCISHCYKMKNADEQNDTTIPDSNITDSKTDSKRKKDNNSYYLKKEDGEFDMSYVDDDMKNIWLEWLEYLEALGKLYHIIPTARQNYQILADLSKHDVRNAERIVRRSIAKGYWSLFPIKEEDWDVLMPVKNEVCVINGQIYK